MGAKVNTRSDIFMYAANHACVHACVCVHSLRSLLCLPAIAKIYCCCPSLPCPPTKFEVFCLLSAVHCMRGGGHGCRNGQAAVDQEAGLVVVAQGDEWQDIRLISSLLRASLNFRTQFMCLVFPDRARVQQFYGDKKNRVNLKQVSVKCRV